jgi:S1-C subfamily serine protease
MTVVSRFDVIPVVAIGLCMAYGLRTGALRIALPLAGLVAGGLAFGRFLPRLVDAFRSSSDVADLTLVAAAFCLAGGFALGGRVAFALAARLPRGLRGLDRAAGVLLGAALGVVVVWLGALFLSTRGPDSRRAARRSSIVVRLLDAVPPGRVLTALHRFDGVPVVANLIPRRLPPPVTDGVPSAVVRTTAASVVKVRGDVCGFVAEGSGWIAGPGRVVTNVHVVTGQRHPDVISVDGRTLRATVAHVDVTNDLAVLAVPGLRGRALSLGRTPAFGSPVAFIGYPGDGPLRSEAGTMGDAESRLSPDAYGAPSARTTLTLRGHARPGNSGGPVIDRAGRVVGTLFARNAEGTVVFATPAGRIRAALAAPPRAVPAGPCPD